MSEINKSYDTVIKDDVIRLIKDGKPFWATVFTQIEQLESILEKQKDTESSNYKFYKGILNSLYGVGYLEDKINQVAKSNNMLKAVNVTLNDHVTMLEKELSKFRGIQAIDMDMSIELYKQAYIDRIKERSTK